MLAVLPGKTLAFWGLCSPQNKAMLGLYLPTKEHTVMSNQTDQLPFSSSGHSLLSETSPALRRATDDIIEVPIEALGIHPDHLVRPIQEAEVWELAQKDESRWEPIEIRLWPSDWAKPEPTILYHVISGNHRTSAARLKGLKTLRARLLDASTDLSYLLVAIRSNTEHGRNFTREEYIDNAKKLQAQGLPLGEIASALGYSKSTVSRWLTGSDSHAASKREPEPVLSSDTFQAGAPGPVSSVKQKVMGLVMDAGLPGEIAEAREYLATLRPAQQEALRGLSRWLASVMEAE
jgi:hypothetical protein